jgi:hypothetical protein
VLDAEFSIGYGRVDEVDAALALAGVALVEIPRGLVPGGQGVRELSRSGGHPVCCLILPRPAWRDRGPELAHARCPASSELFPMITLITPADA